ncbi:hypothetical protein ACFY8B_02330 [Streptomyces sp. NPDC012751]|uniref:hypothetical protein n=1 Tax=Streptomyces sp. NPDC012751 TaxID=3364846 RepID=UPI0036CB4D44
MSRARRRPGAADSTRAPPAGTSGPAAWPPSRRSWRPRGSGVRAIGYRAHTPGAARRHEGNRFCPAKSERRQWAAEDEIVVLPPGPATADGGPREPNVLPRMRRDTEATDAPAGRPPGAPGGPGA